VKHVLSFLHKKGNVLGTQFHDNRALVPLVLNSDNVVTKKVKILTIDTVDGMHLSCVVFSP